jgi:succinate dehydrogenase / fumarate reductase membrane anchor subunit
MLPNITSLTGNGLKDWLIQRISAVYLLFYFGFVFFYLIANRPLDYYQWHDLFYTSFMRIISVIALLMILLHAWIGLWTVTTDYLKCTIVRVSTQVVIAIFLLSQFLWGLTILWGQ